MNSLDPETRARIITALVEGCSIASSSRMTGAKMTVLSLLREVGTACQRYHDAQVRLESDPAHAKPALHAVTNGFSKKLENHSYMLAISMVYYNFCRKHQSLKGQTPAQAAHLTEVPLDGARPTLAPPVDERSVSGVGAALNPPPWVPSPMPRPLPSLS